MEFRILGPLEFIDAGASIALGGEKQRAVLAMLVLHLNQVVSTDLLIDGLWGEAPPHSATNVLQAYVSRLRKAMEHGQSAQRGEWAIRRRRPGYLLEAAPGAVDLNRFQQLAKEGTQKLQRSPDVASARLDEALSLWRGTPLAEFATEPFVQTELPRLEEQRLSALATRVEAELVLGHHAELVGELEALVAEHPLHEGLRRQWMLSLYRAGRQAEALKAYHLTRSTFAEELGIDPGPRLQELEAAILAQDPQLDWLAPAEGRSGVHPDTAHDPTAVPSETARDRSPRVWNVPPRNPHFTGRTQALDELHSRLNVAGSRLSVQALHGLGGVGKTQLAIEFAHRYANEYSVIWWIDAQQPVLIPEQLVALAERLGLSAQGEPGDVVDRLLIWLASSHNWLLIWDNAERPQDVAAYRPAGQGHVVVTSRSPGWGALGGRIEVEVLHRSETVALLRAQMPEMTDRVARELAHELGDLPLAAAQAAAYLEQTGLDPADYLRRFRARRTELLTRGNVLGYRGRVDTAWDLSLERLRAENPAAVTLLEMAAFLGPEPIPLSLFTDHPELLDEPLRAATMADPDAVDDAVGAGVGYSLVRRRQQGFQQHRLIQAVIRHQLPAAQHSAIATKVVRLLAAANPGDPNNPAHWAAYARLAPHVLAAAAHIEEDSDGRQLMLATIAYLNVRGDTRKTRVIAEELLARWRRVLGADHPDTLTSAAGLTTALAWLAEHAQARELSKDTLARSLRVLGRDHPVTLRMATHLTFALIWLGDSDQACSLGQDSLERSKRVLGEDSSDTLRLATNLALAYAWHGEAARSEVLGRETWNRARVALGPDHPVTLVAAAHLALALSWLGEAEQSRSLGQDTLARSTAALGPDHPTSLASGAHLAFMLVVEGQPGQARTLGQDTLERAQRALGPNHLITMISAAVLASARADLGDAEEARILAAGTLDNARNQLGSDNLITLIAEGALTAALAELGEVDRARQIGGSALERSQRLGADHPITRQLIQAMAKADHTTNWRDSFGSTRPN